jgi:hypothetical protein
MGSCALSARAAGLPASPLDMPVSHRSGAGADPLTGSRATAHCPITTRNGSAIASPLGMDSAAKVAFCFEHPPAR